MTVEITVPTDLHGRGHRQLNARRGRVTGIEPRRDVQVVHADVPLVEMFGYATQLRSLTQGRGVFSDAVGTLREGAGTRSPRNITRLYAGA